MKYPRGIASPVQFRRYRISKATRSFPAVLLTWTTLRGGRGLVNPVPGGSFKIFALLARARAVREGSLPAVEVQA